MILRYVVCVFPLVFISSFVLRSIAMEISSRKDFVTWKQAAGLSICISPLLFLPFCGKGKRRRKGNLLGGNSSFPIAFVHDFDNSIHQHRLVSGWPSSSYQLSRRPFDRQLNAGRTLESHWLRGYSVSADISTSFSHDKEKRQSTLLVCDFSHQS